jgi:hypothetical protein
MSRCGKSHKVTPRESSALRVRAPRWERLETNMHSCPAEMLQDSAHTPALVQRADRRSRSLEVLGPHRMISGTNATGLRCRQ